jgi:hypothetical protein
MLVVNAKTMIMDIGERMNYRWDITLVRSKNELKNKLSKTITIAYLTVIKKENPEAWNKLLQIIEEVK